MKQAEVLKASGVVAYEATKPMFKTNYNAHKFSPRLERTTKPSITVPDQTMSVKEILDNFTRGIMPRDGRVPLYSGGSEYLDGVHPDSLDISEKFEIFQKAQHEFYEKKKSMEEKAKQKEQQEFDKLVKQKAEEYLKQKGATPPGEQAPQA